MLHPRILIIDDSAEVRSLLERVLSKDYPTASASTGADALELAGCGDFRITFLASRVLRKEGWALLDSLKALIPQARIIVITDYAGEPLMSQLKDRGLYACIHKPFTINEVLDLVKDASAPP